MPRWRMKIISLIPGPRCPLQKLVPEPGVSAGEVRWRRESMLNETAIQEAMLGGLPEVVTGAPARAYQTAPQSR